MISRDDAVAWLTTWQACIDGRDVARARALFSPEVVAFGTFADRIEGLDALVTQQWDEIWPVTTGFAFDFDSLWTGPSASGSLGFAAVLWRSEGLLADGGRYLRRGRATILLERRPDGLLLAVHTHFSMSRDHLARAPGAPDITG